MDPAGEPGLRNGEIYLCKRSRIRSRDWETAGNSKKGSEDGYATVGWIVYGCFMDLDFYSCDIIPFCHFVLCLVK